MNEEEELKKEKDRYERQNQEAYDEVTKGNEELRRKQEEEKKKGLLDEGSAFRQTAAIGTEVGLNTLLDLFSFEPGSQIAGGSAINYLAQRIRGGEFSKGEMIASGLASLIPGGAQGTALARTAKGIGKGAVSGAIETTGMTTIDEGRLPTAEELATGAGIGGAFGGLFTTAANTQQIKQLAQRIKGGVSNLSDEFMTPFNVARGDLIGAARFGASSSGTRKLTSGEIQQLNLQDKTVTDSYTQKFKSQPWETSENITDEPMRDRMFLKATGRPFKLEKPAPKNTGQDFGLIPDKVRGKPFRTMKKQDINLSDFSWGPKTINASVNRFRRRIMGLMQVDRIRSTDAGTADGFSKTSTNINSVTKGTDEVSSMYFDYLVGYFNRFIRAGKVSNFNNAVDLISPKIKSGKRVPKELQITKGGVGLIRELRLFTMAPDVYKSGAFKTTDKTYQAKLKNLVRRYSTVNAPKETFNKRTGLYDYRFDAHHIDQIAEGWVLYRGLPKEEIPKMRRLIQAYGLEPGNHPDNVLLLLNRNHVRYHKKYWPEAKAKLVNDKSTGWDPEEMVKIKTAAGRNAYVANYVQAIEESRDQVLQEIEQELADLAAKKNKQIADLTRADIDSISDELDVLDPSDPLDRSSKAPKDIQDQIDKDSK